MRNTSKTTIKKLYLFLVGIFISMQFQAKTITGTVSDEDGVLPGVNVLIQSTDIGTETDFDGHYSIEAEQGAVLVFTFIGLEEKRIVVGEESVINVEMEKIAEFTSCGPSRHNRVSIGYIGSVNYNLYGINTEIYDYRLFLKRLNLNFQTDFSSNKKLSVDFAFRHLIKFIQDVELTLRHNKINMEDDVLFAYNDYKVEVSDSFHFANWATIICTGLSTAKLNQNKWNKGFVLGFSQILPYGIRLYSKTTYTSNYWQFENGIKFSYDNFNMIVKHDKIVDYEDFSLGIGYALSF